METTTLNRAAFDESRQIAEEVFHVLQTIDPVRWRTGVEAAARDRLGRIRAQLQGLLDSKAFATSDAAVRQLQERLRHMARLLEEFQQRRAERLDRTEPDDAEASDLRNLRSRLQPAYAAVAHWLQTHAVEVPTLRPTNHFRSVFHVCTGLILLVSIQHLMDDAQRLVACWIFVAVAWSLEAIRKWMPASNRWIMLPFRQVAHPHEHHGVNSATWYGTAMLLMALFSTTPAASVGIIVLAFGDPFAALIGRRYGRIRLVANRSLEGTTAFVLMGMLAAWVMLSVYYPDLPTSTAIAAAFAGGLAGALAELFSYRLDDNFTIPLAATAASMAVFAL